MLAAMARAAKERPGPSDEAPKGRVAQMRAVWSMTRQADPRLPLKVLGPALLVLVVLVVVGILIGHPLYLTVLAILAATLTGTTIFGRLATSSMYAQVEGQPGAAASVLQTVRGDWRGTPAAALYPHLGLVDPGVGRGGGVLLRGGQHPPHRRPRID